MKVLGPNDCIFSSLGNISFLCAPRFTIGNWTKTTFDSSIIILLLSVKAINTGHKDDHLKRVPKIHTASMWEPLKVSAIAVCPQSTIFHKRVYIFCWKLPRPLAFSAFRFFSVSGPGLDFVWFWAVTFCYRTPRPKLGLAMGVSVLRIH